MQPPTPYAVVLLNRPLPLSGDDLFLRLWAEAHTRIAADGASKRLAARAWTADLPLDAVVGDLDSCPRDVLKAAERRGTAVHHVQDQDTTDLEKCLAFLGGAGGPAAAWRSIVVLGDLGGRFDHSLAAVGALSRWHAQGTGTPFLLHSLRHVHVVLPKGTHRVHVGAPPQSAPLKAALLPVAEPVRVTTRGLAWDMDDAEMRVGGLVSACNAVAAGCDELHIRCSHPTLLMVGSGPLPAGGGDSEDEEGGDATTAGRGRETPGGL